VENGEMDGRDVRVLRRLLHEGQGLSVELLHRLAITGTREVAPEFLGSLLVAG
jgi:hypothetical protein